MESEHDEITRERELMVRITGVWKRTDRRGRDYFTGRLGRAQILILPCEPQTCRADEPDYAVYVRPNDRRQRGDR